MKKYNLISIKIICSEPLDDRQTDGQPSLIIIKRSFIPFLKMNTTRRKRESKKKGCDWIEMKIQCECELRADQ